MQSTWVKWVVGVLLPLSSRKAFIIVMTTTNYPEIKTQEEENATSFSVEGRQLARFLEVAIFGQKFLGKYYLCHIYYTGGETNVVCLSI